MTLRRSLAPLIALPLALAPIVACDDGAAGDDGADRKSFDEGAANPLLTTGEPGKADTQYLNPDGIEVEVDVEADLEGASSWQKADGPAILAQYAMTYLRKEKQIYLESLAEQATSDERVEWLVDGAWKTAREARDVPSDKLVRFRIRGINAVLLHGARQGVDVGAVFEAPVPRRPYSIMADAGESCAEASGHISASQSVYWYVWEPGREGCKADKQTMTITVSKMLPSKVTYPEWDQLVADGKITMVVLFGQIGDGALTDWDIGMRAFRQMGSFLLGGGFAKVDGPVGERYQKTVGGVVVEVDIYSPKEFAGLSDSKNFPNFQRALGEHEIVTYDGHSMLGASDFWTRPDYPDHYQIFLYGGCLGYEYYLAPILAGKGGWDKVDILSSVIEVTANANEYAGPFIAKMLFALENDMKVSWMDILAAVRMRVGDSTFGVSGARENCFTPGGSVCGGAPVGGEAKTFSSSTTLGIPDDDATGVTSTIEVADAMTIGRASVSVKIAHAYIGDLTVVLSKGETSVTLWDGAGGAGFEIDETFDLSAFVGAEAQGTWTLGVVDGAAQDVGTLEAWSLTLAPR